MIGTDEGVLVAERVSRAKKYTSEESDGVGGGGDNPKGGNERVDKQGSKGCITIHCLGELVSPGNSPARQRKRAWGRPGKVWGKRAPPGSNFEANDSEETDFTAWGTGYFTKKFIKNIKIG